MQIPAYLTWIAEGLGLLVAFAAAVGTVVYFLSTVTRARTKSRIDELKAENTVVDYYEKKLGAMQKIVDDQAKRIDKLIQNVGVLEGSLKAQTERAEKLDAELRLRNPEMTKFMEVMLTHASNSDAYMEAQRNKDVKLFEMFDGLVKLLNQIHTSSSSNHDILETVIPTPHDSATIHS